MPERVEVKLNGEYIYVDVIERLADGWLLVCLPSGVERALHESVRTDA